MLEGKNKHIKDLNQSSVECTCFDNVVDSKLEYPRYYTKTEDGKFELFDINKLQAFGLHDIVYYEQDKPYGHLIERHYGCTNTDCIVCLCEISSCAICYASDISLNTQCPGHSYPSYLNEASIDLYRKFDYINCHWVYVGECMRHCIKSPTIMLSSIDKMINQGYHFNKEDIEAPTHIHEMCNCCDKNILWNIELTGVDRWFSRLLSGDFNVPCNDVPITVLSTNLDYNECLFSLETYLLNTQQYIGKVSAECNEYIVELLFKYTEENKGIVLFELRSLVDLICLEQCYIKYASMCPNIKFVCLTDLDSSTIKDNIEYAEYKELTVK